MMRRILLAGLLLVMSAGIASSHPLSREIRVWETLRMGSPFATTDWVKLDTDPETRYPVVFELRPRRAAGSDGLKVNAVQSITALTGGLHAGYFVAQPGTVGGTGSAKLMALELKTRQPDSAVPYHSTLYISADAKDQDSTAINAIEISLDGDPGGDTTTTRGVVVYGNSSGTLGASTAYSVNAGAVSGHNTFDYDFQFQGGATLDESTENKVLLTEAHLWQDGMTWTDWDGNGYDWGNKFVWDDAAAFSSGAAKKLYAMSLIMDRPATEDLSGDSRDIGYYMDYTNRSQSPGFTIIGMRGQVSNRAAGTLEQLKGFEITARQRGDGSTLASIIGIDNKVQVDNGGTAPSGYVYGNYLRFHLHVDAPANSAGFIAENSSMGSYDAPVSAYSVRKSTASSGWDYGYDAYYSTANPIGIATIRGQYQETINNSPDGAWTLVGTLTAPQTTTVTDATDTRVCTAADYGKIIILTHADNVAVTLPANGAAAGSWIDFMWYGNDSLAVTISAATTDTLRGGNDADLKSITFGSSNRIGAYAHFVSNGSFWEVYNPTSLTMTYTD